MNKSEAKEILATLVAQPTIHVEYNPTAIENTLNYLTEQFTALKFNNITPIATSDKSKVFYATKGDNPNQPTVLLYSHYDVQPVGDEKQWVTNPFELTEKNSRWYGRGSADCKGNITAHLLALQSLTNELDFNLKVVFEGSEEAGGAGLADLINQQPELFKAEVMLIVDAGNVSPGIATLTTSLRGAIDTEIKVSTMENSVHSGQYGGPAPDALSALIQLLNSLKDTDGNTTIDGFPASAPWTGYDYTDQQFLHDIKALPGVERAGTYSIAEQVWDAPAVTIVGMQVPDMQSPAAIPNQVSAKINLRIPPGIDAQKAATLLENHLQKRIPWHSKVEIQTDKTNPGFATNPNGPAFKLMQTTMGEVYSTPCQTAGMGGSIPLCTQLQENFPQAEILLYGVEDPDCNIHAPNESVDPEEILKIAKIEADFLQNLKF